MYYFRIKGWWIYTSCIILNLIMFFYEYDNNLSPIYICIISGSKAGGLHIILYLLFVLV